jgi:hypothetical protein
LLDTLITNKTRLKLLIRFFIDPETSSYLRGLEDEFGESTNAIRIELNRFEAAGLLVSWEDKNKKMFAANREHPLFGDIHSILRKHTGIDTIIHKIIGNLGNIESAYLKGFGLKGSSNPTLDLIIFGESSDREYLLSLANKASTLLKQEIICIIYPTLEEKAFTKNNCEALLIWKKQTIR